MSTELRFPTGAAAQAAAAAALTPLAAAMPHSRILTIAGEVRAAKARGETVGDFTVGDFSPAHFRPPEAYLEKIAQAMRDNTNYPPSDGIIELRHAIVNFMERRLGVKWPVEGVVVGSGARPPIHALTACALSPGDSFVHAVPTWNMEYYAYLAQAREVAVPTRPEDGFMPTLAAIKPHLADARLLYLNSPLNPCGTVIPPETLREICEAVVAENARRERPILLLNDMVYWMLTYRGHRYADPVSLVPEMAQYTVNVDAVSKTFAATGLRVGWAVTAPHIAGPLKAFIGHVGAWAPRPEQVATAWLLDNDAVIDEFLGGFRAALETRLTKIYDAFSAMKAKGLPVDAIAPQGAIYLSAKVDLVGRRLPDGSRVEDGEQVRKYLLKEAGVAVVPFSAFGSADATWFRFSVGAVGLPELDAALDRLQSALERVD